jgi:hypothetical protein
MTEPPRWAEQLLLLVLPVRDQESITGDLLEEYRDLAQGDVRRATRWYVREVLAHLRRRTLPWAVLFSACFVGRTAVDWLYPVTDFHTRSAVSTFTGISILFAVSFVAASKARRILSGLLTAAVTSQIAAFLSVCGISVLLLFRHDSTTWNAINTSGGLAEAFQLPFFMIVPGVVIGLVAGVAGKAWCTTAT